MPTEQNSPDEKYVNSTEFGYLTSESGPFGLYERRSKRLQTDTEDNVYHILSLFNTSATEMHLVGPSFLQSPDSVVEELLWSPYVIGADIIFLPCDFYLLSSFFRRLISAVGDWMSTILPHMVWP